MNALRMSLAIGALVVCFSSDTVVSSAHAQNEPSVAILHVNVNRPWDEQNPGNNEPEDGLAWSTSYRFLQNAITRADQLLSDPNAEIDEVRIWIAAAFDESDPPKPIAYRPDQFKNHPNPDCIPGFDVNCCPPYGNCSGNLSFDFTNFPGDVRLLGGFPPNPHNVGQNGATLEHRDPYLHKTVLSGDLMQNDQFTSGYDANGILELNYGNYSIPPNYWNSVVIVEFDSTATLVVDGLTIRGAVGSAIVHWGSSGKIVIQDCVIEENFNGGMHLRGNAEIRRTIVRHNGQSGAAVGGIDAFGQGNALEYLIIDSEIVRNIGGIGAGGMQFSGWIDHQTSSTLTLVNVKIQDNLSTIYNGGGVHSSGGHLHMSNCLVTGNRTLLTGPFYGRGGGIYLEGAGNYQSNLKLVNCTIADNHSGFESGGGGLTVYRGGVATAVIRNSIIWGNTSGEKEEPDGVQVVGDLAFVHIDYSNV